MPTNSTRIQTACTFGNGTQAISGYVVDSGNNLSTTSQTFAAASTNAVMTMSFIKANLQSFILLANQPCVIKTNSSGSPSDTITLVAGVPYSWSLSSGLTNPFATNVTTAFVTCTPATQIQMGILQT